MIVSATIDDETTAHADQPVSAGRAGSALTVVS